jgi:ADP-heptose:LPS heptosyltransferase/predicted SAM-dependent methyltransferase
MTWKATDPQGNESGKIRWELVPYTRGRGLDLGCGPYITFPHFIRVDNCIDEQLFGTRIQPNIKVDTCENLEIFGSKTMDFVFSSHLLEHIEPANVVATLREWWRVLKMQGFLVLYVPADDLYPKVGEPGANPDHKWNVDYAGVIEGMKRLGTGWDLIRYEHRSQGQEYSHLFVFKKVGSGQHYSYQKPADPRPKAAVVRYGAWGDNLQASSVIKGLHDQGFHVTLYATPPGSDIMTHDPHIDEFVLQDKDQVPNNLLGDFWASIAKKYDRFVNLSESIENTVLSTPGRIQHSWPPALRHAHMNVNYLELQHDIAQVPHKPQVRFYPTAEERTWARKEKDRLGGFVIAWSLAGSSVHKTWPYLDNVIAAIMMEFPDAKVVLLGGPAGKILEAGWENEKRVVRKSGEWSIRQSLSFVQVADLVIGPETGVMNCVSGEPMPKVLFLSHSTHENLSRDWENVHILKSDHTVCPGRGNNEAPACHQLHFGWDYCKRTEAGTAQCQTDIPAEEAFKVIWHAITWAKEAKAKRA